MIELDEAVLRFAQRDAKKGRRAAEGEVDTDQVALQSGVDDTCTRCWPLENGSARAPDRLETISFINAKLVLVEVHHEVNVSPGQDALELWRSMVGSLEIVKAAHEPCQRVRSRVE